MILKPHMNVQGKEFNVSVIVITSCSYSGRTLFQLQELLTDIYLGFRKEYH